MTTLAIRSVRAGLLISAAALCVLFFAVTIARAAPGPAGSIAFVGTDSNIYYCDAKCAQPKCITCKAPAMRVRRDDGIVMVQGDESPLRPEGPGGHPANSTEYGL